MKITKVEAFHVDWGGGRNRSAWVRIGTDAGVTGLGEASPMVHGNARRRPAADAHPSG
jgi:L-alanine-DL-glutamate epimerase-like enolase superfamily enzyme